MNAEQKKQLIKKINSNFKYNYREIMYPVRIRLNTLRVKIVNKLLGDELILQTKIESSVTKVRLTDMKRRIPYGWWVTTKINERDTRLSR